MNKIVKHIIKWFVPINATEKEQKRRISEIGFVVGMLLSFFMWSIYFVVIEKNLGWMPLLIASSVCIILIHVVWILSVKWNEKERS